METVECDVALQSGILVTLWTVEREINGRTADSGAGSCRRDMPVHFDEIGVQNLKIVTRVRLGIDLIFGHEWICKYPSCERLFD